MVVKKLKIKDQEEKNPIGETKTMTSDPLENEGELAVDVFENDSDFIVMAAVAGISAKDVDIQIDKDMLVIKGCRACPNETNAKNYFYQECHWGSFSRKIMLPEDIDSSAARAEFKNGILQVKFSRGKSNKASGLSVEES